MDVNAVDFEGKGGEQTQTPPPNNENNGDSTTEEKQSLDGTQEKEDVTGKSNQQKDEHQEQEHHDENSSTGELSEGDTIEFDGTTYTVDAEGNLVDAEGNIFKEAKDVQSWLNENDVEDENTPKAINLANLQEKLGITVTDYEGKTVEFTDDADGVEAYVNAVIDLKSKEIQDAAINKLYTSNPLLKEFSDYVQLTGSPRGFGEIPDRSGIKLDKDNIAQQEAIIRMAAQEFGNKSLDENYIKYLRDGGGLYDVAKSQLEALVEKDKAYRENIRVQAEAQRKADEEAVTKYWNKVNSVIDSRLIAGYKLPESFIKEVNGQKITLTPNDFYKYLSKASEEDANGNKITSYQRDLNNLSEDDYLNRELLDAWLMFTGGSYADLVKMAVNEEKVRQLKVRSKEQRTSRVIKVVKKGNEKSTIDDILL